MEPIIRQQYLDSIEKAFGKEIVVVLTGQRRVGKSCLLKTIRSLKSASADNNVIYIDKEKREFDLIKDYSDLNNYIEAHFDRLRHNYILIDEVQEINEFERSVRSFRTEPDTDVVITGSNARMLSGELATILGGRYKEILIQPLSYAEFLRFHSLPDSDESLTKFIEFGGMPGLAKIGLDPDDAPEYLLGIYRTVLLKDVIVRNNVRNVVFLENLVRFLADNSGKLISSSSVSKFMRAQGESITPSAILSYLSYLCQAYIIARVNRFDIRGKRIFETNDKFYFCDHGVRNAIAGGRREGDIEKVIESVVYQHLIRLGYRIFVGQLQAAEIDFVCEKPSGERAYVQVAYIIADDFTRQREFGNLCAIPDNYPKFVISLTPLLSRSDSDGIVHLHLRQFLTSGLA